MMIATRDGSTLGMYVAMPDDETTKTTTTATTTTVAPVADVSVLPKGRKAIVVFTDV
jgi:hypothetical protein